MYITTYQRDFLVSYTVAKNSQRLYSPRINFWEERVLPHRFLPHTPPTQVGSISAVFNPQVRYAIGRNIHKVSLDIIIC